jgi:hypothetical protein
MYDLQLLHGLCDRIQREKDPEKLKRICAVLRAILQEKGAETNLRLKLLQKRCYRISPDLIPETNLADLPKMDIDAVRPASNAEARPGTQGFRKAQRAS